MDRQQKVQHEINTEGTKCLTVSKELVRCKLEINRKIIEQVKKFPYLGVLVTSYGDITEKVRIQANKAATVSEALREIVWKNKGQNIKRKTRIYVICKTNNGIQLRSPDRHKKTKQLLRTNEMKLLQRTSG